MKYLLLSLLAVIVASCSSATSAPPNDVLNWTHPTLNTDGTALPLAQIKHTLINWGPSGGPYLTGSATVLAPATTVSIPRGPAPGTVCYIAFTVNIGNIASDPTGQVCVTVYAKPNPPTGLTAN